MTKTNNKNTKPYFFHILLVQSFIERLMTKRKWILEKKYQWNGTNATNLEDRKKILTSESTRSS